MATVPMRTNTPADPNRLFGHEEANQPFWIKSAVYDVGTDTIAVTIGPGRVDWGGGDVTEKAADTVLDITPVAINTEYFVFVDQATDGFTYSSVSAVPADGQVRLGSVATGADKATLTRDDLRGMLPVPTVLGETPTTQDYGDVAAEGTSTKAARADHRHGMPAQLHIEAKSGVADGATVTFTTAFATIPAIATAVDNDSTGSSVAITSWVRSRSTTSCIVEMAGASSGAMLIATEAT